MHVRHPRHLLVPARGGASHLPNPQCRQRSAQGAHLRDIAPAGPRAVAEAPAVPDFRAPHGSASHSAAARRRNPPVTVAHQPYCRCSGSDGRCVGGGRPQLAPRRRTSERAGSCLPLPGRLLHGQQAAQCTLLKGEGDAQGG
ncbi:unnamed protein product [Ixodes persulcatus]